MRRRLGFALLTLGFFVVTLAPMLRFYAAPKLTKAPLNEQTKTTYVARGSSYIDLFSGAQAFDAALVQTVTINGDVRSGGGKTAVWNSFTALEDSGTGEALQVNSWRMAFDRKSGLLKNCCGAVIVNRDVRDTTTKQQGLGAIWPVADVSKKTYQQFDPTTKLAWPATYAGTERISGISTYKFVQRIQPTRIATLPAAPLQGLSGVSKYPADVMYSAVISTWVDPRTGMPVDQRRQITSTVRGADGSAGPTVLSTDLRVNDTSRAALVRSSDDKAGQLTAIKVTWPLVTLIGGLILLAAGAVLNLRGSGAHASDRGQEIMPHAAESTP